MKNELASKTKGRRTRTQDKGVNPFEHRKFNIKAKRTTKIALKINVKTLKFFKNPEINPIAARTK
tara:strand:- start:261 stop:455 length:195 start_codon:yes stop_codon:yes gene_type:complete